MSSRILYVTHRVPWPPDRGDRIRTWNILKFLSSRADVDLACLADEPVSDESIDALKSVASRIAIVPHSGPRRYVAGVRSLLWGGSITEGLFHSAALIRVLQEWGSDTKWTAALASSSGIAGYLSPEVIGHSPRRWVDLIDVDSQKWMDYSRAAAIPKSLLYGLEGRRLRHVERQLAESCEKLLVVSEAECQLFRSFCPTQRITAVANGVDTDYFAPGPPPSSKIPSCVFVGVMNYLPNVDAVCWFASVVWPKLRLRFPEATFRIVGKSPTAEVRALESIPGIHVVGPVPDVRPWLYQAHCAVVPLRIARGIQNKVLEAMACGRPVICSPAPLKGLAAEPGLHLLQAESADEWVSEVGRVFEDSHLRQDLSLAAAAWVRLHHCWDACLEPLCDLLLPETEPADRRQEVPS